MIITDQNSPDFVNYQIIAHPYSRGHVAPSKVPKKYIQLVYSKLQL